MQLAVARSNLLFVVYSLFHQLPRLSRYQFANLLAQLGQLVLQLSRPLSTALNGKFERLMLVVASAISPVLPQSHVISSQLTCVSPCFAVVVRRALQPIYINPSDVRITTAVPGQRIVTAPIRRLRRPQPQQVQPVVVVQASGQPVNSSQPVGASKKARARARRAAAAAGILPRAIPATFFQTTPGQQFAFVAQPAVTAASLPQYIALPAPQAGTTQPKRQRRQVQAQPQPQVVQLQFQQPQTRRGRPAMVCAGP